MPKNYLDLTNRISTRSMFLMLGIIFIVFVIGAFLWAPGQVPSHRLPATSQPAIASPPPAIVDPLSRPQLPPAVPSLHRGTSSSKANLVVIGQESDCLDMGKSITLFCYTHETKALSKS
jgi:hypothetical protein